jgi:hypothetical protein
MPQHERDQSRHGADDEHPTPAEGRNDSGSGERRPKQANREDHLVGEEGAAAALRAQNLADVARSNRDFPAEADALDEAEPEQLVVALRECARKRHDGIERNGDAHRRYAPDALGDPSEGERADGLAEIGDAQKRPDLLRRNAPVANDDRQHISDRQRVEGIEEDCNPEDDGDAHVPARVGQALEPRGDRLLRQRQSVLHRRPPQSAQSQLTSPRWDRGRVRRRCPCGLV